ADSKLKKISISGGAAVTLCDVGTARGGSWGDDDNIVFSPDVAIGTILQRVSSAGGKPQPVTKLVQGEVAHRFPQVLPGAKAVLYSVNSDTLNWDNANIIVQPLSGGAPKILLRGGYHPQYVPSGHIVYIHEGNAVRSAF